MARVESNGFIGHFIDHLEQPATKTQPERCFDDGVDCVSDAPDGVRQHMPHEGDPYAAHARFKDDLRNNDASDAAKQLERMTPAERQAELDDLYRNAPERFASLMQSFAAGASMTTAFGYLSDQLAATPMTERPNAVTRMAALTADAQAVHNEILGLTGPGAAQTKRALLAAEKGAVTEAKAGVMNAGLAPAISEVQHSIDDPTWGSVTSMYREHPHDLAEALTYAGGSRSFRLSRAPRGHHIAGREPRAPRDVRPRGVAHARPRFDQPQARSPRG